MNEPEPGVHVHTDPGVRCLCHIKRRPDMPASPELEPQDPLSIDGPDEAHYLDGY